MVTAVLAAVLAFVATNVDDLVVLVLLFGASRPAEVVAGQYLGIGALAMGSVMLSMVALALPMDWAPLLGVLPIAIGANWLLVLRRGRLTNNDAPPPAKVVSVMSVAMVTIANGGDNVAVYVPLFARHSVAEVAAMLLVFLILIGAWCVLAWRVRTLPVVSRAIDKWGHIAAPIVLVLLGLYILSGLLTGS